MKTGYEHYEQVTDEKEIAAVKRGTIAGEVYADGQVWAEVKSLEKYRTGEKK